MSSLYRYVMSIAQNLRNEKCKINICKSIHLDFILKNSILYTKHRNLLNILKTCFFKYIRLTNTKKESPLHRTS